MSTATKQGWGISTGEFLVKSVKLAGPLRRQSRHSVIGLTCGGDRVGLDS